MKKSNQPEQSASGYYYDAGTEGTQAVRLSAQVIVPILMEYFQPNSVVDFGCGLGDWLSEFSDLGVGNILGLDGEWVPLSSIRIPKACFNVISFTSDYEVEGRFDMATCFEVAEHFTDDYSKHLLDALTKASDIVVFSAAVPGQGGYKHVNEHFQQEWIDRFSTRGYTALDLIRPRVWMHPDVSFWYQQNILVFCTDSIIRQHNLQRFPFLSSVIHPELYHRRCDPRNWSVREIIKHIPYYFARIVHNKTQNQ